MLSTFCCAVSLVCVFFSSWCTYQSFMPYRRLKKNSQRLERARELNKLLKL